MRRWISYLALLVAAFSIWFGTTHRFSTPTPKQAWVAQASRVNSITGTGAGVVENGVSPPTSPVAVLNQTAQAHVTPGNETAPASASKHTTAASTGNVKLGAGTASARGADVASRNSGSQGPASQSGSAQNSPQGNVTAPPANTTAPAATSLGNFTIRITLHHGATLEAEKQVVLVKGESLMWYMTKYFRVTTIDGGAFLVGIDGINSQWTGVPVAQRQPVDWFLYVNQQQAPVGAASIIPRSGDMDVWDYHSWNPSTGQGS